MAGPFRVRTRKQVTGTPSRGAELAAQRLPITVLGKRTLMPFWTDKWTTLRLKPF